MVNFLQEDFTALVVFFPQISADVGLPENKKAEHPKRHSASSKRLSST